MELGRNDACHCGSGKKYKKCHLEKDEAQNRKAREKAALNAAKVAADNVESKPEKKSDPNTKHHADRKQGFFQKMAGRIGFSGGQARKNPPQNKGG